MWRLCKRYSIAPQPFTRVERELLSPPFITSRTARQFGRDVVRCMVSLYATGQEDILKCRQPVSDEDILNAAEAYGCTDETVQWLLIGYANRIEVDGCSLVQQDSQQGGVLNPKAAEEWWTGTGSAEQWRNWASNWNSLRRMREKQSGPLRVRCRKRRRRIRAVAE